MNRPPAPPRDYQLILELGQLPDEVFVGAYEVAQLTGFALKSVQQRKLPDFPLPVQGIRRLRWRLGEVRCWLREFGAAADRVATPGPKGVSRGRFSGRRHV